MTGSKARARPAAREDLKEQPVPRAGERAVDAAAGRVVDPAAIAGLQRTVGNAAVAGLVAPALGRWGQPATRSLHPTGPPTVQRAKKPGLVFHPKSTLSAEKIVAMLKRNKNVPDFIKKSLAAKDGAIILRGKLPTKPAGTFSEFLEPYLAAMTSTDWQFTTATSTIDVTGEPGSPKYLQIVRPDLAAGQRLGKDIASGPGETTFFATPLYSSNSEVIYGWTVEAGDTGKLGAGRGLIVVVTKITVTGQNGKQKVFTPTEDTILEAVLHEVSAHAGRMTEGKPDTHGNRGVEDIAEEIGRFFRYSADAKGAVPSATSKDIFAFIEKTATKAP